MFDAEAASFVCDFIECLTCSNGAPFRLMDWQRDAVTEFYGQMVEAEGEEDVTIVFAFLTDNAGIVPACFSLMYARTSLEMVVGSFPNSAAMAEKLFCFLRPTSIVIRSLRVRCVFLAIVFSVSLLPPSGEDEGGSAPYPPEVYRFHLREGSKKGSIR